MKRLLDNWQFWVGVAYFGLAAVTVALWFNYSRVSAEQVKTTRIAAERHADIVANADAQYEQCVKSIPSLRRIDRFAIGVEDVHAVLLENSLATHRVTPAGTAVYQQQIRNIARLRRAFDDVKGVHFAVPTPEQCMALRTRLLHH